MATASTPPVNPDHLHSLRDVADRLGLTYAAVKKKYQRGYIPVVRIGGRVYVTEQDLAALLRPRVDKDTLRALPTDQPPGVVRFRARRPRGS